MSREIKFRAWHKDLEDMTYSDSNDDNWYNKVFVKYLEFYNVMQFTGLKDKNGKEIYEGDIISNYGGCVIVWRADKCKYDFRYPVELMTPQWMNGIDKDFSSRELEVIGNIHQSPELLNNGNN